MAVPMLTFSGWLHRHLPQSRCCVSMKKSSRWLLKMLYIGERLEGQCLDVTDKMGRSLLQSSADGLCDCDQELALWVLNWAIYKTVSDLFFRAVFIKNSSVQKKKKKKNSSVQWVLEHLGAWKKYPAHTHCQYFSFRLRNLSRWEQGCALGWADKQPRDYDYKASDFFFFKYHNAFKCKMLWV